MVDLAVGFVMGVAFTTVVNQFITSFLDPLIRLVSGGEGITAGTLTIRGVVFDRSAFVNAVFHVRAHRGSAVHLVVMPMNKLAERRRRGEEPPPEAPSEGCGC